MLVFFYACLNKFCIDVLQGKTCLSEAAIIICPWRWHSNQIVSKTMSNPLWYKHTKFHKFMFIGYFLVILCVQMLLYFAKTIQSGNKGYCVINSGWRGGSVGRVSDSRSKGSRFEPCQEHTFVRVFLSKYVVLTRCRCAQPRVPNSRPYQNDHVRTLKIL